MNRVYGNQTTRALRARSRRRRAPAVLAAEILEGRILLSAAATHLVIVAPGNQTAGTSFVVYVDVDDNTNTPVATDHSTVTLTESGPGPFTTGHTSVMQSAVGGVASFTVTLDTAGTYTFTATDGRLGRAVYTGVTVGPDTTDAEHLAFVNVPSTGTAGLPLHTFDVVMEDQFGNKDTTSNGDNVVLTEAGPGAFDPASQTSAYIANGVAIFNDVILDTAGVYKLSAYDANNYSSIGHATSGKITIGAGQAAALSFEQGTNPSNPLTGVAGKAFTPTQGLKVDVVDAYGNLVTTDHSSVSLVVVDSPNSLDLTYATYIAPINLTATAVGGVATFKTTFFTGTEIFNTTALGFEQDLYLLKATDAAHGIATSADANSGFVQINATTAKTLQFIVQPTSGQTSGTPVTPPFDVAVEDMYGNVVTTSNALVTVTIQSGDGNQTPTSNDQSGATNGIAVFSGFIVNNFAYPTPGSFTLEATSPLLTSGHSTQFTVT